MATVPTIDQADQPDLVATFTGLAADPTREALAQLRRVRGARQGHAAPPAGGLFDTTARNQQELF